MNEEKLYEMVPAWGQNLFCSLHGFRLKRLRYNKLFYDNLCFLENTQRWSKDLICEYKEDHIHKILEYSYINCPYYNKRFKEMKIKPSDFKSLDDLSLFPILSKEDVRANWQGMVSSKFSYKDLIPYHTSGSTGKALDFYWTKESIAYYWSIVWRGRQRFGIGLNDKHLNFTGKRIVPLSANRPPYWRYNWPMHQYLINMQHINLDKVKAMVDFINKKNFKYFIGYPSIINSLSVLIAEKGLNVINAPQYVFTGAEKLYKDQCENIGNVFRHTKIVEHYGFSENAAAASKCVQNKYHEDFELGHFELEEKRKVEEGYMGNLLVTGFMNYGMPFIRYQIGDTAIFENQMCNCGLQSQVIYNIEGRNEDYVITPEGMKILRFDYIFKNLRSIKECQVVQRELGGIVLRIVKRNDYVYNDEMLLREEIKKWISPLLKVEFEYVDEIHRTRAGKFRAVVSELEKYST